MANIKQQKKRIKTNEKKRLSNAAFRSSLKSAIKDVEVAVDTKNLEAAISANNIAHKKLDKSVSKGLSHKNYVARQKSRLSKLVNTIK
ncbi:30S ribosomal protein S20 [Mycoplasmatota bacterium]|nr:30S ribosomal protein S20 [Mycoplasmatota bacterium]